MKTLSFRTLLATILTTTTIAVTAQTLSQQGQQSDSVVAIVADAQGLPFVPASQRPFFGTFWEVRGSLPCVSAPLPCPPRDPATPVYFIGGDQYLVDETGGEVISPEARYKRRSLRSMDTASILQAQLAELQGFVGQIQTRLASVQARSSMEVEALAMDAPPILGSGTGTNDPNAAPAFIVPQYTTNDLWLEIVTVTNSVGTFTVHAPAGEAAAGVYDLLMTTNLSPNVPGLNLTNWYWLLRTDPGQTNVLVPDLTGDQAFFMLGRTNDTDADGMSDAYEHFVSHTSPTNQDAPNITIQPLSQTVYPGDTVTFSVAAEGAHPLTYQWLLNGTALPGETNTSLTFGGVQPSQAGDYSVQVTSPVGLFVLSSNATLSVSATFDGAFIWLVGPRQDFTFRKGVTYLVDSRVELYGTTTVQGGCVVKPDWYFTNSTVAVIGTLVCKTDDPNLPAYFTSVDDDSIGQAIDISTGVPETYTNRCAFLDLSAAQISAGGLSNLRICYADGGITTPSNPKRLDLWHSQFLKCNASVQAGQDSEVGFHNVLFADCNSAVGAATNFAGVEAEHVTAAVASFWNGPCQPAWMRLTNSIITSAIPAGPALATDHVAINPAGPAFQTNGCGSYYLAENSLYRSAGSTNISPRLKTDFRVKTTRPPLAFPAQMELKGDITLSQQPGRYTNGAPDYGYYYQALDYTVAWMKVFGTITVLPGTTIGFRQEPVPNSAYTTAYGFDLREGSRFIGHGTAINPVTFVDVQFIQEEPSIPCLLLFAPDFTPPELQSGGSEIPPSLDFRFAGFYTVPGNYVLWSGVSEQNWNAQASLDSAMFWSMRDCAIHGGNITVGPPDWYSMPQNYVYGEGSISWINNLFDQVAVYLNPTYYPNGLNDLGLNVDMSFVAYNNLFRGGGWFYLGPIPSTAGNWVSSDNLFERVRFIQNTNMPLDFSHNAYWPLTDTELAGLGSARLLAATNGTGLGEQVLAAVPPYQRGPLGDYYLPNTTPLYHAGSRTPSDAGLFHYTTRLDQIKEGSEISGHMVNIGLHYLATAGPASLQPKDSDSDGIPDYVENASGTGTPVANETDWQSQYTTEGVFDPTNSVYDDIDLSGSGLVGRVKKALGLPSFDQNNPLVLTPVLTGEEPDIATFSVPLNYDTLTNVGHLQLALDGAVVSFQDCMRDTNGCCLLAWNTTFNLPGHHLLQARLGLNGKVKRSSTPASTILTANGHTIQLCSSNVCRFDPFYTDFDDQGALLFAAIPEPAAEYAIEVRTPSGAHLRTLTNSTTSGAIEQPWDLKDDAGAVCTNDTVIAVFSVSLASGRFQSQRVVYNRFASLPGALEGDFTVAYAWDDTYQAQNSMWWAIQYGIVDTLIKPTSVGGENDNPYTSSFNEYTWPGNLRGRPGYLASTNDVQALTNNLAALPDPLSSPPETRNTRNFHFDGHGNDTAIGNSESGPGSITISSGDLSRLLGNTIGRHAQRCSHPYRFVFLNACETADNAGWAHTFGIRDRITGAQAAARPQRVQAFLGWKGCPRAPEENSDDWDYVAATFQVFYSAWMSGWNLDDCVWVASQTNPPFPYDIYTLKFPLGVHFPWYRFFNSNDFRLQIYGYAGITRTGYHLGHDNSPYYPAIP